MGVWGVGSSTRTACPGHSRWPRLLRRQRPCHRKRVASWRRQSHSYQYILNGDDPHASSPPPRGLAPPRPSTGQTSHSWDGPHPWTAHTPPPPPASGGESHGEWRARNQSAAPHPPPSPGTGRPVRRRNKRKIEGAQQAPTTPPPGRKPDPQGAGCAAPPCASSVHHPPRRPPHPVNGRLPPRWPLSPRP